MDSANKTTKNKEELKARIVETANKLFSYKGIKAVHMDDVANELSISKRTLYELFTDKENLLLQCVIAHQQRKLIHLQEIAKQTDNPLELVLNIYKHGMNELQNIDIQYLEDIKRYPTVMEHLAKQREEETVRALQFYKKGVEIGVFRADVKFEIFHRLMNFGMDGFLKSNFLEEYPLTDIFDTVVMVYMRGICTTAGLAYLENFLKKN